MPTSRRIRKQIALGVQRTREKRLRQATESKQKGDDFLEQTEESTNLLKLLHSKYVANEAILEKLADILQVAVSGRKRADIVRARLITTALNSTPELLQYNVSRLSEEDRKLVLQAIKLGKFSDNYLERVTSDGKIYFDKASQEFGKVEWLLKRVKNPKPNKKKK
ncbi:MAG: hypothetical protein Q7K42_02955 [Candidatus Diapherotrites archaeon]|nr:hypothetical protein [Candidatus Diapherotrites archaeon]